MWIPEDDLLFLKYVSNKRDKCYHMMALDTSARPHEILNLKIKDVMFKLTPDSKRQYAEVLLNGKTGSRPAPLIQSIPYVKAWLDEHPRKNVPNSPLFVSLNNQSNHYTRQLTREGLYGVYDDYKKAFFPKLLQDPAIPAQDKEKIKALLAKPWNPYTLRHSGIGCYAFIVKNGEDNRVHSDYGLAAHNSTNNVAEYTGTIRVLITNNYQNENIVIKGDSRLVINQLKNNYQVRAANIIPLYLKAKSLVSRFKCIQFEWIPRERNREADKLACRAYEDIVHTRR